MSPFQYLKENVIQYVAISIYKKDDVQYVSYFEFIIIIFIEKHVSNSLIFFQVKKKNLFGLRCNAGNDLSKN
jgi:hypothetical protein